MNTHPQTIPATNRSLLLASLTAFALVAALPVWHDAYAQTVTPASTSQDPAVRRHNEGLALERRHDDSGAFFAFLSAARAGYAPAQRRIGEILDRGNTAVERDYEESLHWYELARAGGEDIPLPSTRMPRGNYGP